MTEREKMLAGELYTASDAELSSMLARAQRWMRELNSTPNEDPEARRRVLRQLMDVGDGTQIRSPFYCDYGVHVRIGRDGFISYGCVLLDCNWISIGDFAQIGPGVHIYTAHHPLEPATRRTGLELATAVWIGNDVWIGGGAIIFPGVTIGDDAVIGAGSVVTRDVPAGVLAVGNPCRVVREIG